MRLSGARLLTSGWLWFFSVTKCLSSFLHELLELGFRVHFFLGLDLLDFLEKHYEWLGDFGSFVLHLVNLKFSLVVWSGVLF
jgi:hypothetical protein